MFDYIGFGNRILMARMRQNMKQQEVAKSLKIAQSTYSDIENGKREINITQLFAIAALLDVSIEYLLGLSCDDHQLTDSDKLKLEEYKLFLLSQNRK